MGIARALHRQNSVPHPMRVGRGSWSGKEERTTRRRGWRLEGGRDDHSDVTPLSNKHSIPTAVRSTALHSRRNNRQEKHEGSFRFLSTSCRYSPKPAACSNSTSSLARRIRKTRHAGKTLLPSSTQVPRPSRQYSRNSPFRHACREWSKTDTSPRSPCSRSTRPSPP